MIPALSPILVEIDGQVVERTDNGRATISQLISNTEYCFQVVAIDALGNRSAPSNQACGRTLQEDAGLWRMRLACDGREYLLENNIDLQATSDGVVNFAGSGNDYDGTELAYIVSGIFDPQSLSLDGRITYTFADIPGVRIDEFIVDLSNGDSGDVLMNQVQVTGCESVVRFDLVNTMLTMRSSSSRLKGAWPAQTKLNMTY